VKLNFASFAPGSAEEAIPVGPVRLSLASTTTVYLVARCDFAVSTCTAGGVVRARRVR